MSEPDQKRTLKDRIVRQRVRIHDRYQLEIKVEYPLSLGKRTRYNLTTYLFIPQNLAINELSYTPSEFYRRIQNYIRFKTPEFTAQALLSGTDSPLCIIESIWHHGHLLHEPTVAARLIEQFKFLRAILRRTLTRSFEQEWRALRATPHLFDEDAITTLVNNHIALVQTILARFRQGATQLPTHADCKQLCTSYQLTDEAISQVVESNYLKALLLIEQHPEVGVRTAVRPLLAAQINRELDYRAGQGYQSIPEPDGTNERYLHHISMLKKYTSSVLYLATARERDGATVEHILFAIAAGVSMVFATVIAFWVQAIYGNFTFPLFIALVVGYMFKDRIKELGRSISTNLLRRFYYDRRIHIYTLDRKQRLGRIREKMVFLAEDEMPPMVKAARAHEALSLTDIEGQREQVVCYTRNVTLAANAFRKVRGEGPLIDGLSDIIRLDVRPFLHKMDNPTEQRLYLEGDRLRTLKCARVYYVNIVSTYSLDNRAEQIIAKRVRVTLNRKGLVRLQEV